MLVKKINHDRRSCLLYENEMKFQQKQSSVDWLFCLHGPFLNNAICSLVNSKTMMIVADKQQPLSFV